MVDAKEYDFKVNGKIVSVNGECGIYKARGIGMDYGRMDPDHLVATINSMPLERAVEAVTYLRDEASKQVQWTATPRNLGSPILRQTPGPTPIDRTREYIRNTEKFCNDVLNALAGK